jgi:hypothetical protein
VNVKSKGPLPGTPNVEVVYDTSPETTTRAATMVHCWRDKGSCMLKLDELDGLRGLGHRSVIPYVHGRELYCCVCVALFKVELNLVSPIICPAFYSSRPGSYTVTQGLTGGTKV